MPSSHIITKSVRNGLGSLDLQATQEVVSRVPQTTAAEFNEAVQNAQEAFKSWRNVALPQRQRVMFRFQELIRHHTVCISRTQSRL